MILAGVLLATSGCPGKRQDPVHAGVLPRLGVRFGASVQEVASRRPGVYFQPYVGWVESPSDPVFSEVQYGFDHGSAGERPDSSGLLSSVTFIATNASVTASLVRRIEKAIGAPSFLGCTPVPRQGVREEIAVLRRATDGQDVILQSLVRMADDSVFAAGPLNVTVRPSSASLATLGIDSLSTACFSSQFFSNPRPAAGARASDTSPP